VRNPPSPNHAARRHHDSSHNRITHRSPASSLPPSILLPLFPGDTDTPHDQITVNQPRRLLRRCPPGSWPAWAFAAPPPSRPCACRVAPQQTRRRSSSSSPPRRRRPPRSSGPPGWSRHAALAPLNLTNLPSCLMMPIAETMKARTTEARP